jgi:PmbA protein
MTEQKNPLDLAGDLVDRALKAGADSADAVAFSDTSLSVNWRMGALEELERSESTDLGLRVFVGQRMAIVSTTDPSDGTLTELVDRAVAMARIAPEDKLAGLAEAELLATEFPDLDLDANDEPAPERMMAMAQEAEDAARAVEGITNTEGASTGWHRITSALAGSNGFQGSHSGTSSRISAAVIAGEGLGMERDGDYRVARHMEDLPSPAEIGAEAARRTLLKLNPKKLPTKAMPIVFDDRNARSLLGHFVDAISGPTITRGTSFLKDSMGEKIFGSGITIVEDPHRQRGLRSRPFDGEGLETRANELISKGTLTTWLLDCRSARQLELAPTGHATRGTSGSPSPSPANLWLEPGTETPEALMADIKDGLYVTYLIGFGVNGVTGDYSRGAAGFRIQNGELTDTVSEITIAGNLIDMYANLIPANDLQFLFGTDSPSVRIDGMTVAGV